MGQFVKGDVVVMPFPFSDLTVNKRRPALVLATMRGDDLILCQVTSKTVADSYAISLTEADFTNGNLHQKSNTHPNRLFTEDSKIIIRRAKRLKPEKVQNVIEQVIQLLTT